jgi:hypothetical protein
VITQRLTGERAKEAFNEYFGRAREGYAGDKDGTSVPILCKNEGVATPVGHETMEPVWVIGGKLRRGRPPRVRTKEPITFTVETDSGVYVRCGRRKGIACEDPRLQTILIGLSAGMASCPLGDKDGTWPRHVGADVARGLRKLLYRCVSTTRQRQTIQNGIHQDTNANELKVDEKLRFFANDPYTYQRETETEDDPWDFCRQ